MDDFIPKNTVITILTWVVQNFLVAKVLSLPVIMTSGEAVNIYERRMSIEFKRPKLRVYHFTFFSQKMEGLLRAIFGTIWKDLVGQSEQKAEIMEIFLLLVPFIYWK